MFIVIGVESNKILELIDLRVKQEFNSEYINWFKDLLKDTFNGRYPFSFYRNEDEFEEELVDWEKKGDNAFTPISYISLNIDTIGFNLDEVGIENGDGIVSIASGNKIKYALMGKKKYENLVDKVEGDKFGNG